MSAAPVCPCRRAAALRLCQFLSAPLHSAFLALTSRVCWLTRHSIIRAEIDNDETGRASLF